MIVHLPLQPLGLVGNEAVFQPGCWSNQDPAAIRYSKTSLGTERNNRRRPLSSQVLFCGRPHGAEYTRPFRQLYTDLQREPFQRNLLGLRRQEMQRSLLEIWHP